MSAAQLAAQAFQRRGVRQSGLEDVQPELLKAGDAKRVGHGTSVRDAGLPSEVNGPENQHRNALKSVDLDSVICDGLRAVVAGSGAHDVGGPAVTEEGMSVLRNWFVGDDEDAREFAPSHEDENSRSEAQARHDWFVYAYHRPDEFKNCCDVCGAIGNTAPSEALTDDEPADLDCCEQCYVEREGRRL